MNASNQQRAKASQVLIVVCGQAGIETASSLRQHVHDGSLLMVSDERVPAYQRPPLSKQFLTSGMSVDDIVMKPRSFFQHNAIELVAGVSATAIDRVAQMIELSDGSRRHYD